MIVIILCDLSFVYALVPLDVKEALDLLIRVRTQIGISPANEYLFAVPNTENSFLRGDVVVRKMAGLFNLRKPELMKSTKLRQYLATTMQVRNVVFFLICQDKE